MSKAYNMVELAVSSNPLSISEDNGLSTGSANSSDLLDSGGGDASPTSIEGTPNNASRFSCFINLSNTLLGSGMLGLPYAVSKSGWLFGSFMIILCGTCSTFSLHTLALCALETPGPSSFSSVSVNVLPEFSLLVDIAVSLKCFGIATSYFIVMGDMMPDVMEQFGGNSFSQSRHLWVLVGFIMVAPLCCLRNLDSLRFTSFMALGFVFFLTIVIVLYASDIDGLDPCDGMDEDTCTGSVSAATANFETLKIVSIYIFGFACQQNIFPVVNELKDPTPYRITSIVVAAVSVTIVVYLIVAGCGYATYGTEVDSDILKSYPENYFTSLARIMVSLLVAFSYPLQAHPGRRCMLSLTATYCGDKVNPPSDTTLQLRYTIITGCFLGLSLFIGLIVSDLGVVLALVGATGSTIICYIFPGFLYYYTFANKGPAWKRRLSLAQGILGLLIIPLCITFIFL